MSNLPVTPLTPDQQQRLLGQIYTLLGRQVQSYHGKRHMGTNSSVPVELAQELTESLEYTVWHAGGFGAHKTAEGALLAGQRILEEKLDRAKSLLKLVEATAPHWQTECRWEAIRYLSRYLESYDLLHLAHLGPDGLFYPILIAPPEGARGIDETLFYLHILWTENRIMGSFPDSVLDELWSRLPVDALNQCQQLLVNAIGKALIGSPLSSLVFLPEQYPLLVTRLLTASEETLRAANEVLCRQFSPEDENSRFYAGAIFPQIRLWTGENCLTCEPENIFL